MEINTLITQLLLPEEMSFQDEEPRLLLTSGFQVTQGFWVEPKYIQELRKIPAQLVKDYECSISLINLEDLSNENFFLKRKVEIILGIELNGYVLSNDDLHVYAFGETIAEAEAEWKNILISLYLSYHNTLDNELTEGGKALKDKLQSYVGERR